MPPKPSKGKFITLEGGEGTGKSTQARALRDRLEKSGVHVVKTREPGGTAGAEIVRHLLKSGSVEPLGAFAEAVMITAARDDHVTHLIRPALEQGNWVICDRFSDSTRAYQGAGGGVDDKLLSVLERMSVGETKPDLTIILDAPADLALARALKRERDGRKKNGKGNGKDNGQPRDRFEKESLAFHEKLRRTFLAIATQHPDRCVVIDATQPEKQVAKAVWQAVANRLTP